MYRRIAVLFTVASVVTGCSDISEPAAPSRLAPYIAPSVGVSADIVPDEYLVVLDPGSDVPIEASRATLRGGRVLAEWESALQGYAVRIPAGQLTALRQNARIRFITANQVVRRQGSQSCAPYTSCGWGLDRIDQASPSLNGSYAYPSATGSGVRVYIIDSGVRTTHAQFQGRATWGPDFIDGTKVDCDGHGTHVAATVAGKDYGVAKGASIVAVRVLNCMGSGTYAQVISGINWVTKNAVRPAVANMSLGGPPDPAADLALNNSIAAGISYIVAAGNNGANACNFTPARVAAAITVGATGSGNGIPPAAIDARPSYSNFGNCLDLFAPGTAIRAAYNGSDTQTAVLSGTSMASPHVAGAAALLLARHSALTPAQVRDTLVGRALSVVVANGGSGSPNRLLNISFLNSAPPSGNRAPVARYSWACDLPTKTCTFDATSSTDDQGITSYAWTSSDPTRPAKSGTVIYRYMDKTTNTAPWSETLTVTDAQGLSSTITQAITPPLLSGNRAPSVSIAAPVGGAIVTQGQALNFAGSANDPEQGALTGAALAWTSSRDGQIGTGAAFSTTTLSAGSHVVTLTATDAQGATGSAAVTITVNPPLPQNAPPVAAFTVTCNAVQHYCELDAGTSTDDKGLANLSFAWSTNDPTRPPRSGQVIRRYGVDGASGPWSYTETLTVRDSGGLTRSVSKVITIQ